ncbi:MAG: signal peptidase I [Clostridium sp.]|uniref:signal peptidase I n=1 Tax=Clostridium sp. TaxID=1506 RepID=UPI003F2EE4A2
MSEEMYIEEKREIRLKEFFKFILVSIVVIKIFGEIFPFCIVKGHSMENTLENNEVVVLNKLAYILSNPQRGEIIVIDVDNERNSEIANKTIVKRIIGEGGERLTIKNNKVYINEKELKEEYIKEEMVTGDIDILIPIDEIFVMGDNRNESGDSRDFGTFRKDEVKARVMFKK